MDLILWRHAEAEPGDPDEGRVLTAKGSKQAWKVAEWLDGILPDTCRILSSPAARALQTAEALGRKFKVDPRLGPDSTADLILQAVDWPNGRSPVLVVGHQPTLGQVASLLLGGAQQDWPVRKGSVWWLGQREPKADASPATPATTYLRLVMPPELVRKSRAE